MFTDQLLQLIDESLQSHDFSCRSTVMNVNNYYINYYLLLNYVCSNASVDTSCSSS
jgi:hypothetical protein